MDPWGSLQSCQPLKETRLSEKKPRDASSASSSDGPTRGERERESFLCFFLVKSRAPAALSHAMHLPDGQGHLFSGAAAVQKRFCCPNSIFLSRQTRIRVNWLRVFCVWRTWGTHLSWVGVGLTQFFSRVLNSSVFITSKIFFQNH